MGTDIHLWVETKEWDNPAPKPPTYFSFAKFSMGRPSLLFDAFHEAARDPIPYENLAWQAGSELVTPVITPGEAELWKQRGDFKYALLEDADRWVKHRMSRWLGTPPTELTVGPTLGRVTSPDYWGGGCLDYAGVLAVARNAGLIVARYNRRKDTWGGAKVEPRFKAMVAAMTSLNQSGIEARLIFAFDN